MNALTLTLIRLAFLAVLWLFVIAAVGVGTRSPAGSSAASRRPSARGRRGPRGRDGPPGVRRSGCW
jgi:hypothetical protein